MNKAVLIVFALVLLSTTVSASGLDIDSVKIDGSRKSSGTIYAEPGEELQFEVTIENTWDKDDDDARYIDDVRVTAVLYDIDDDLTYTSSRFDLRPEGYKTIRFDFDIPEDADSDRNYDLEITASGTDEEGETATDTADYEVEIEREEHDVSADMEVSSPPPCTDTAKIRVRLENDGEYDEEFTVRITNPYLGEIYERELELDAGEDESLSRSFDISGMPEGRHTIYVKVEMDNKDIEESGYVVIPYCGEGISEKKDSNRVVLGEQNQRSPNRYYFYTIDRPQQVSVEYKEMTVPPYQEKGTDWGLVALILANMLLGIILVAVIVVLVLGIQAQPTRKKLRR